MLRAFRTDLEQAGPAGLRIPGLEGILAGYATGGASTGQALTTQLLCTHLTSAAKHKGRAATSCAFIAGYDGPRLISNTYCADWAVRVFPSDASASTAPQQEAMDASPAWASPRAWKSLTGESISSRFQTGLQQLLSQILVRAGTTRARLCEVMRRPSLGGWDRLEVCDLLAALGSEGTAAQSPQALPAVEFRTMRVTDGRLQETKLGCHDLDWAVCSDDLVYVVPLAGATAGATRSWWRALGSSHG